MKPLLLVALLLVLPPAAGLAEELPDDDRAAHKALAELGASLDFSGVNLWKVTFVGDPITDADLDHFQSLHHLEILTLTGAKITDKGLAKLVGKRHLRYLELDGTAITDAGLVHMQKLPALEVLSLNSTRVSDAGLAHLKPIKMIDSLRLNGTRVSDAGLAHLLHLPKLQYLEIAQYAVESFSLVPQKDGGGPPFKAVPNVPDPPPGKVAITDAGLATLSGLAQLEKLNVSGTGITDAGLPHLAKLPKLTDLFLDRTTITDTGLAHLGKLKQLRWLWLEETKVTDSGLVHLKDLQQLEMLVLENTKVTNAGLVHLYELKKLKDLFLENTAVTEQGVKELKKHLRGSIHYDYPPYDRKGADAANEILNVVRSGNVEKMRRILNENPDAIHAEWTEAEAKGPFETGKGGLHFTAETGDLPMLKLLLAHGARPNEIDAYQAAPLHYAADKETAEALIAAGADVHAGIERGWSPLHAAANRDVAEVLLANGAEISPRPKKKQRDGEHESEPGTPLHDAARLNRLDVVALLIERGADVNATERGSTPLYWPAYEGHAEMVKLLLKNGARVNGHDDLHWPLDAAIQNNRAEVVRLLLDAGTEIPEEAKREWTLLHTAVFWHCGGEIIEMLLGAGLPIDEKTEKEEGRFVPGDLPPDEWPPITGQRTALHIAAELGNLSAAKVLIAHGADIQAKTTDGETPLSLTRRPEAYAFTPWIQGTSADIEAHNLSQKREIETRNANRKAIAELIDAQRQQGGK